jgi:thiol-disulfide isomerase/thioredoxin
LYQFKTFCVKGFIRNYIPNDENRFVTFRTYEITGLDKDTSIIVDKQGRFNCELVQSFEGDIGMIYRGHYINMYAIPSDTIGLEIDEHIWSIQQNKANAIEFSGNSAQVSRMINEFKSLYVSHKFGNHADIGDASQPDKVFATKRIQQLNEELDLLNSYLLANKITELKYTQWAKNHLIYAAGVDIVSFPFYVKRNRQMTFKTLIDLLGPIKLENNSAMTSSNYYGMLYYLSGHFEIIANLNPEYQPEIDKVGKSRMLFILNQLDHFATGKAKEFMYFDVYTQNFKKQINDCDANISRFESVIIQPDLKALFQKIRAGKKEHFEPFSVLKRMSEYPLTNSISSVFAGIITENPGKYLFIDFWGSWCAPCMNEMPLYPKLIENLKEQPVVFIFLAVETDKQKIQETKEKYHIDGRFISLNDNDTRMLNNILQFSSYPAHFLIDPNGMLVNNALDRLDSGGGLNGQVVYQIKQTILNR